MLIQWEQNPHWKINSFWSNMMKVWKCLLTSEILGICQQIAGNHQAAKYSYEQLLEQVAFNGIQNASIHRIQFLQFHSRPYVRLFQFVLNCLPVILPPMSFWFSLFRILISTRFLYWHINKWRFIIFTDWCRENNNNILKLLPPRTSEILLRKPCRSDTTYRNNKKQCELFV